jgi:hypothetical protein
LNSFRLSRTPDLTKPPLTPSFNLQTGAADAEEEEMRRKILNGEI